MNEIVSEAMANLVDRRFRSFSDACEAVLGALERALPGSALIAQLDADEEVFRVLATRGEEDHLRVGAVVPVSDVEPDGAAPSATTLRPSREFLDRVSAKSCLAMPLEMSDGNAEGMLCSLSPQSGSYDEAHLVLFATAARLLSYEWEGIRLRAEARHLGERLRDSETTDPVTGLPNRQQFLELLAREWQLVQRGAVESYAVAVRPDPQRAGGDASDAIRTLALKNAADVLRATLRDTDLVGRVGERELGAVLVACHGREGAEAVVRRLRFSLQRVAGDGPAGATLRCGINALADAPSAEAALDHAARALEDDVELPSAATVNGGEPR